MTHIPPIIRPLIATLLLAGACAAFFLYGHTETGGYSDTDPTFNKAYWVSHIQSLGGQKAYALFMEKNTAAPLARQHFSAHVLGGSLYEVLGIKGLPVCTAAFSFGCYHGFFARAIATEGIDSISALDAQCVEAFGPLGTGCQHGIGHGIMEYVGYQKITEALSLCGKTHQLVPLLGCTSGVFMEFNSPLPNTGSGKEPSTRSFDSTHPYAPCTDVPKETQSSCYFELSSWYVNTAGQAANIQSFCGGLSGENRASCFLGFGANTAFKSGYDTGKASAACSGLSGDEVVCRAGVSWGFRVMPQYGSQSKSICTYGDTERTALCQKLSDLTNGLNPLP